jgi:predicted RNA-binding protein associated with RNAse of E/G family
MTCPYLPRTVKVVYKRLPNDVRKFPAILREKSESKLVVQMVLTLPRARRLEGRVIADSGFSVIWFIYRGRWYDIGKFYDKAGTFLGYYCDIVKPTDKLLLNHARTATLTDLYLDLWITPHGKVYVLDEDELQEALRRGHISATLAKEARKHLTSLVRLTRKRHFPPKNVRDTQLFRCKN